MGRAKVFIHIGPPKTGSSSIQDFFDKRANDFLRQKILYPKSGRLAEGEVVLVKYPPAPNQQLKVSGVAENHRLLAWSVRGSLIGIPQGYFWQQLHDEINDCDPDVVLISAEQFGNFHIHEISALKDLTMKFGMNPTILHFTRCPIRHLYSKYCEHMKMGISSKSLNCFLRDHGYSCVTQLNQIPRDWGSCFGSDNIISINFDAAIEQNSLGCSVLNALGVNAEDVSSPKPMNSSPSHNIIEILRFLNWLHHRCIGRNRFSDIAFRSLRGRALNQWGLFRYLSVGMANSEDPSAARKRQLELIKNWLSNLNLATS